MGQGAARAPAGKAAEGFAKKQGVGVDDLEVRDGFLGVLVPGRPLLDALPERLNEIVRGLAFSKSMRWDDSGLRFARPVRWLCAKLDDRTVEGFGGSVLRPPLHASAKSRSRARGEYLEALRAADVEPDPDARLNTISQGLGSWASPSRTRRCWQRSSTWPSGRRSSKARSTSASSRFRAAWSRRRWSRTSATSRSRATASRSWPTAATRRPSSPETRRVLEGRLEDASFTFERDVAKGIERLAEEATRITFVAGAGSYGDKVARLRSSRRSTGRRRCLP